MANLASSLPQEIITEILSRVPAKSIGKFRCVSKPWQSLLCSKEFIKTYLTRHTQDQELKLILLSSSNNSLFTLTFRTANEAVSRMLNHPQFQGSSHWISVVGSCNGVVLVINEENSKFFMNPTTLEHVKLSNSPLALDPCASFSMHGFGYDSFSDDYKIVTLSYYDTDNEHEPDCTDTFVDIYSVKKGNWRRLGSSPYDHAVPDLASGVFLNGAIHWLASSTSDYSSVIAAFDLESEEFKELPAPRGVCKDKFVFNKLVALGSCLGMVDDHWRGQIDVWLMREYGVEESWNEFILNVPEDFDVVKPLCILGDDQLILLVDEEKLTVYNLTEKKWKVMVIDGVPAMFVDGTTFSESLISPNFSTRNEEQHSSQGEN